MKVVKQKRIRSPFLIVNPKAYLYGTESLSFAVQCDRLAGEYDIDIIYTAMYTDIRMIKEKTKNLVLTAQHMDTLYPGRGMGWILPESLREAGADAVILNHAEHPVSMVQIQESIKRADELGMFTILCADSEKQAAQIAKLHPTMIICEPDELIGTGTISSDAYIEKTNQFIREINPDIFILQCAGITTAEDVRHMMECGADGSGGTSGILKAPNPVKRVEEMLTVLKEYKEEKRIL